MQGKVTYVKRSGEKRITINKKNGKVTVRKGLAKKTYCMPCGRICSPCGEEL